MASTYSSIATHMWPPPSSETATRLQRLQELEQMRKQRQLASGLISNEPTDAGTRLSRRQQISGSIGIRNKLIDNHEERRKSFQGRRTLAEGRGSNTLSMSQGSLSSRYGGARPKNLELSSSLNKTDSSQQLEDYGGRERSSSLTNTDESLSSPLLRSQSETEILSNQSDSFNNATEGYGNNTNFNTHFSESAANTSVSEDEDDIESFRRSLLGIQSLANVQEKDEPVLHRSLPMYTRKSSNIDSSKLLIHRSEVKDENFSARKSTPVSNAASHQRVQNMVSESMKRLDSLFDTTPSSDYKRNTIPRSGRYQSRSVMSKGIEIKSSQGIDKDVVLLDQHNHLEEIVHHNSLEIFVEDDRPNEVSIVKHNTCDSDHSNVNIGTEHELQPKKNSEIKQYNTDEINDIVSTTPESNELGGTEDVESKINLSESNNMESSVSSSEILSSSDHSERNLKSSTEMTTNEEILKNHITTDSDRLNIVTESHVGAKINGSFSTNTQSENTESLHNFGHEVDTDSVDHTHSPYSMQKEEEDDLLDASNVGYFEMETKQYNESENSFNHETDISSDFPQFTNAADFLNYDNDERNTSESERISNYGQIQAMDKILSRTYGNSDESYHSRYRTLPYSRKEQSIPLYNKYENENSNVRKTSLGPTGISQDALSRINDLFGKKTETTMFSNSQSTVPRRRARDTLTGSRTSISRSRSDAGESGYEGRRATLLSRNSDGKKVYVSGSNYSSVNSEEKQQPFRQSVLSKYSRTQDHNESKIEGIQSRSRNYSSSGIQTSLSDSTFQYTRSRSVDLDNMKSNSEYLNTDTNYIKDYMKESDDSGVSFEISKIMGEISSEFLTNDENDIQYSNETLTPDTIIDGDLSNVQSEGDNCDTLEEEVTFSSSCQVEVGQVLVCDNTQVKEHGNDNVMDKTITDENMVLSGDQENHTDADFDTKSPNQNRKGDEETIDENICKDTEKMSSDETDNKSMTNNTSLTNSKKKKNKKKVKKGNNSDTTKLIVSHPSELFKKTKKDVKTNQEKVKESKQMETKSKEKIDNKDRKQVTSNKKENKTDFSKSSEKVKKASVKDVGNKDKKKEEKIPSENIEKSDSVDESPKSRSKLKNLFDTIFHPFDHKSEASPVSSVILDDNRSQSSGEKTPVADDWEIISDPLSDLNVIHEDNYASFENEDIITGTDSKKRKISDELSGMSTDNYETASDNTISGGSEYEEFYEALPTELFGGAWKDNEIQNETERKEQFVYVCAASKVRMKRKKAPPVDKQRVENVNQWIENNLYPSEKYPQQGEKVAKKKFVDMDSYQFGQNDELMNTRENLESMNERENLSKGMPNYCVDISSQQVMKTQSKDMVFEKNEEEQLSNLITIEKTDNIDEKTKVFKTETFSENNVRSCEKEEVHVDPKLLESVPLDLKASDSGFTDTLVNALREKLCQSCQGVLIDVLKQTYFTRYEQIAEIHLQSPLTTQPSSNVDTRSIDEKDHTKISKTTSVVENNHSKMCKTSSVNGNDYSEMSKTTSVDGKDHSKIIKKETTSLKKIQKPKKLEVTDLLYEKTNKENLSSSDSLLATGPGNTVYDNTEAIENNGMQKLKRLSSPKKSPPCEKAIILAKNDNFKGTSSKTSPNNHTAEIKTKGKMVSSDKSKTNGKVLPKSEPRLCQQNPKHVKTKQGVAKVDEEGKHPTSGEDEEYKLPHLKDNPFIKKDKLGKSNSEHNQKSENSTKKFMIKRSMSLNIDSSKVDSQSSSKSLSPVKKTSEITGASEFAKTEDIINGKEKNEIETLVNETYKKKTETGKELESKNNDSPIRKASFSKKHSPKSPKKPSMFDHLNFAKEVCGNIGEPDNIDKKLSETENSLKTKEPPELNKIPLRSKTPPRKKKFSPFGDVIDDRDLSPEEAHGVPIDDDEIAPHRINLINWDPTKLLNVLYTVKLEKDTTEDISHQFVNMEGLMEKLPMNKKKATLLKTWKRRFFRAKDGWLHYYETSNRDKPSDSVQLMGGKIEDLGNRVLGVDDGRGRFLMVRCPTEKEYGQWKLALESQTVNNVTYVRPVMSSPPHPEKKVIIIDIGSGGIRAGVMGAQPCLPQMFFPSVVARHKTTQELVIGIDAYKPEIRKNSTLIKLVEPSNKVDKDHVRPFAIDMEMMSAVFDYIFKGLKADSAKYWIMLSTPYKLGDAAMSSLMKILTDRFNTKGVCMVMQSLLALYSYNATSGIIVDIGERMEILPIFDGVLIEGGVSRQSYGGQKIADSLNSSLVEHKYNFVTPVDKLLVRYVMEQSCYVCENYKDMKSKCDKDSDSYKATVYLNNFDLPEDAHMSVTHDISCFKSAEGFFNTDLWGMDYPCVHKLIYQAIQSCPMDNRKHMYRAIYLSGGVTMLPGFSERLQAELKKLAPPSVLVEVHASPQRYYSAFIGAGTLLSNLAISEQIFISSEEWKKDGAATFRRWKAS